MRAAHKSERPAVTGRDAENQGTESTSNFTAHEQFVFGVLRQLEDGQQYLKHAGQRLEDPKCGAAEMQQIGQQLALMRAERAMFEPLLQSMGVL